MLALLERPEALPTAIACGDDVIASGCMDILAQRGILVPEHISVMGYGDVLTAQLTHPKLTTVRRLLNRSIAGRLARAVPRYHHRESSGAVQHASDNISGFAQEK